ncbi:MAG: cyclic nucleotide-binding and patatin-like phospholipase domain-containing protein [Candidatus Margulisiibacteriota bacterium]|jgi:NTE family protein
MDLEIINKLREVFLFSSLAPGELNYIAEKIGTQEFSANEIICREGAVEGTLYVIISGHVQVSVRIADGSQKVLAILKQGDHFGEMAILSGEPRSATITTCSDCVMWVLQKKGFDSLLADHPEIAVGLSRALAHRLQKTNKIIAAEPQTSIVTFVTDHNSESLISEVSKDLQQRSKKTKWIEVPKKIDSQFLEKLQKEKETDIIIVNINFPLNEGGQQLLAISHRIISVGHRLEGLKKVFTLPPGNPLRFKDSIVRKILGKSIGLALSSGTAQGLTHLGVIKVLEREGIPIDMIAGTSGGALYGAPFAAGISRQLHEEHLARVFRKGMKQLIDFNFPLQGLIKGDKLVNKVLKKLVKDMEFSEVKIPMLVVATDITQAKEMVYWEGSLAEAVRASISIPAIFCPVRKNGSLVVDGVVTTPVPVDPLYDFGVDKVIAVFVAEITRFVKEKPKMLDIFMRARSVTSDRVADINCERADLVIRPDAGHIGYFEYERVAELIKIGEQAAEEMLPAIRAITQH